MQLPALAPSPRDAQFDLVGQHLAKARAITRQGRLIGGVLLLPALAWLSLAPLASAVVASGHVKVDLNRSIVQHAEGGTVRAVYVRDGQKVSFSIDAFPGRSFEGAVRQVRKAAVSAQNVVSYTVVVGFANPGSMMLPGMTANVRIITDTRDNVLKVPNAALRVRIAMLQRVYGPAAIPMPGDFAKSVIDQFDAAGLEAIWDGRKLQDEIDTAAQLMLKSPAQA